MNHIKLFSITAPCYNLSYKSQVANYRRYLHDNIRLFPRGVEKIVDIGCGTGAFSFVLQQNGFDVTGCDASELMLKFAKFNLRNTSVRLICANMAERMPFKDNFFDMAVCAYFIHGFKKTERKRIYSEIKRVCSKAVLFHEFFPNKNIMVSLVEWLERSDYEYFSKNGYEELCENFEAVQSVRVSPTSGWYLCLI